jgi:hypothetical protein
MESDRLFAGRDAFILKSGIAWIEAGCLAAGLNPCYAMMGDSRFWSICLRSR